MAKDDQLRYTIFNQVVLITLITYLLFLPIAALVESMVFLLSVLLGSIVVLVCLFMNNQSNFKISIPVFLVSVIVSVTFMSVATGRNGGVFLGFIPVSVMALLFVKRKVLALLPFLACVILFLLVQNWWKMASIPDPGVIREKFLYYSVMVTLIILGFVYNEFFRNSSDESIAKLVFLNMEIKKRNADMMENIRLAREIQFNLLPPEHVFKRCFPDSFVIYQPRDVVSGDFYWVEEKNKRKYCAVIDCTGHGVPGSFVSILGHQALYRCLHVFGLTEPVEIMYKLHEFIYHALRKEENDILDGMDLALVSYDMESKKLSFCGAGSDLLFIRDANKGLNGFDVDIRGLDRELYRIRGQRQSVGSRHLNEHFKQVDLVIERNDAVYLYTDGYVDQFGGPTFRKLMHTPLKKLILEVQDLDMVSQKRAIEEYFDYWKGEANQVDDVCIIGLNLAQ